MLTTLHASPFDTRWLNLGRRVEHSTSLSELFVGKYAVGVIAAYDIYGPFVEVIVPDGDAVL